MPNHLIQTQEQASGLLLHTLSFGSLKGLTEIDGIPIQYNYDDDEGQPWSTGMFSLKEDIMAHHLKASEDEDGYVSWGNNLGGVQFCDRTEIAYIGDECFIWHVKECRLYELFEQELINREDYNFMPVEKNARL